MAREDRRSPRHLIDEIRKDGTRFRFFQAVRLLALEASRGGDCNAIPSGLRFSSQLSFAFQPSEITRVEPASRKPSLTGIAHSDGDHQAGAPPEETTPAPDHDLNMTVGFMGLVGSSGVLPVPYTELLIDQHNQHRDQTAHRFLDLFTHRAISLFYRAWRKHRFYLQYESGDTDGFARNLLDLVGLGLQHLQRRLQCENGGIPDRFMIHYAGLLAQKPISSVSIAALVRGFFNVDAELDSFVGQWMPLPRREQSALDGRPCQLGFNTFVGERLWDRQTKIRLRLGALDRMQFSEFMPGQPGLVALRELIRFSVGLTLDCDVKLILKRTDIPEPVLTSSPEMPPKLGYNLWLHSRPPAADADDVCFALLTPQTA